MKNKIILNLLKTSKGLTLVEVLIASALMVIISVPLGSIMRSAINSWQVIPEKTQIDREIRTAIDAIGAVTKQAEDILIDNYYGDSTDDLKIVTSSGTYYFYKYGAELRYYQSGSSYEKLTTHCNNFEFSNPGGNNLILIELTLNNGDNEIYEAVAVPTRLVRGSII
jgi:prepilin-type N-terminal cleavage/methylation domain-containing protein